MTTDTRLFFTSTLLTCALAACDAPPAPHTEPPALDCPDVSDTSKPPTCPTPPACPTCETCAPPVDCPPPDDRTPDGYMTCQEWLAVAPVLERDPDVPPLCLDLTPWCEVGGPVGWCAPGETTVIRVFPVGAAPQLPPLPGCVETGDYACDQQAHVDCCAW